MSDKRYFLEVTSGEGPRECQFLASCVARILVRELAEEGIQLLPLLIHGDWEKESIRSILFELSGEGIEAATASISGTVQWIGSSPFRLHHKRRNWFVGVRRFQADLDLVFRMEDVEFSVCRSGGPGGQHVNTSDSCVQALHRPTGIRVEASEERSQHRNRRLAVARLAAKLATENLASSARLDAALWRSHHELERGNPIRVIRGEEIRNFD